ncbi:CPBP family intramembrane glutamic endopeptidase [Microbacterium sulfonylureivorans]|uniref:CPBP family intramembrane glutamic endopeptidase n=1 Tax=Microbacterium sulfonylureivorans TaxID=2486854 RepID=UPI000FDB7D34|nr:CPBP family intramembrane glutamic endopeptidase [Microbacterium sulfonylureivorans]
MRVAPKAWIGIAVWATYVVVIFVVGLLSGVPYTDLGDSADTLFRGAVLFLAVGAVVAVVATTVLGWWKPAIREERRSHHKWPVVAPALMAVAVVLTLSLGVDWSRMEGSYVVGLLLLAVLVGFNEEIVTRGLLLTGLRGSVREPLAWFISSALFALMHGVNVLMGAPALDTVQQIGFAFLGGTAFYIVRRVTGSLIWAMVLHGAWDFTTFASGHAPAGAAATLGLYVGIVGEVLALVFVFWTFRSTGDAAATAAPAAVTT